MVSNKFEVRVVDNGDKLRNFNIIKISYINQSKKPLSLLPTEVFEFVKF